MKFVVVTFAICDYLGSIPLFNRLAVANLISLRTKVKVYYSESVITEPPLAFVVLHRDVGYAMQFAARWILYDDY